MKDPHSQLTHSMKDYVVFHVDQSEMEVTSCYVSSVSRLVIKWLGAWNSCTGVRVGGKQ